jgi:hypothetical protein
VRHVGQQVRADLVGDRAEPGEVPVARIGGRAGDDQLGLVLERERTDRVHVEPLVLAAHAIGHRVEPLAAHVDRRAVGQVSARGEVEPHEGVAWGSSARNTAWFIWLPELG